jgi:hypothetical protein
MLKDRLAADSLDRLKVMLETCMNEIRKQEGEIQKLKQTMPADEVLRRANLAKDLLLDGARKAVNTRSIERVRRLGLILANATIESRPADADEIEEMMRVAMELGDDDIRFLRELVRVEGEQVRLQGRLPRYSAHTMWEQGFWGSGLQSDLDSVFSKLESYGLVARIPPPNNLNITADFQNRYVLLLKGLRWVDLVQKTAKPSD